ncbi:MAG: radical SAM-associated putative lipoprotein [Muribaculaceae bacterium]|nr:radical SAM-associated putative lipoprotein [Muribaculaceae bacterium]MDE6552233.1 radical SAM-associated putative lipoprotein [Muribaculaceae bacterium]
MRLIKRPNSSLLTSICSLLLSLLGFSCSSPEDVPDMYGQPVGDFEIKGAVTDEAGSVISNAEIRVTYPEAPSGIYRFGETKTNSEGSYEIKGYEYAPKMKVVCIPENSDLQPDSVIVNMEYKDRDKHDSWNLGHAEATVDFSLKSKKE